MQSSLSPDQRLKALNVVLPPPPVPLGVYKPMLVTGSFVYTSGHGTIRADGSLWRGKVGSDLTPEQGKEAARLTGLAILSTLVSGLGSLNRIKRVIKVLGMVNCTADFARHPYVINGCSELFASVWGEEYGIGTRSAVGMGSLPDNIPVEIEAVFELV